MCTKDGIMDEACKQCSTNVGATRSGKMSATKIAIEDAAKRSGKLVDVTKQLPKLKTK